VDGQEYILIDTPGFNDTKRSDRDILHHIVEYLSEQYHENKLLSGIIYLHPITATRMSGTAMTQLKVFKELCGHKSFGNVLIGTTGWDENVDQSVAKSKEEMLCDPFDGYLGELMEAGAKYVRVSRDYEKCLALLDGFVSKESRALKVQEDMAGPNASFETSDVAKALAPELAQLEAEHAKKLREEEQQAAAEQYRAYIRHQKAEAKRARAVEAENTRMREAKRREQEILERKARRQEEKRQERIRVVERERAIEKERQERIAADVAAEEERKAEEARLQAAKLEKEKRDRERKEEEQRKKLEAQEAERRKEEKKQDDHRHTRSSLNFRHYSIVCETPSYLSPPYHSKSKTMLTSK